MTIDKLTAEEAAEVLKQGTLGRLGCIADGEAYVVPVHYFFDGESVYIHSLPGKKINALRAHPRACLQVDDVRDSYHWRSVLAYGNYEEITDERLHEMALAELFRRLPHLTPVESRMTKGVSQTIVFRLHMDQVTGVGETW
ncbi:MAG TPA: pyridoxamine 5'-phosphate oxidase family protein [Blastocatellia bacterium]|nr:pyridoxamine 5'-phosphate oxidase family protein [Blastocatellia bacterium]HMV87324.1 pyridoxamine 5'-phosphate oxidase family protein [Blastocatellia bacterium]HMX26110.1 pyridoxamine 5'-phosphate oxidase family protein [Blastocatellia bacterium]HMY75122.1 pyridoxamine 5'-phosphate oxidase family protein [Blastocatellia bacterium]HMZ23214.1 pyridoxamine 5'-phosphate oxidase family protein [Blastocatellia bacterium]